MTIETPEFNDETHSARPRAMRFPVVGIGASAGGLEAIGDLLSNMGASSGMAMLVVQHLDPDHPSMLTDILARRTVMPVVEAEENQLIQQNHIYVIPPKTSMTISRGRLVLTPRQAAPRIPMPIDDLFFSLSHDQGANAIGVLLSGSGSDGALGMQAIKGEGGITFAQEDNSAKFNSMPRAAISLGCVDFIQTPDEIAEELVRIGQNPIMTNHPLLLDVDQVAADEASLSRIFQILNKVCKHDFAHYKRGTLTRRLTRRVALLNLNSLKDYIAFLEDHEEEVQALYQDLLIRVTSFFRDPQAFEGLSKKVFPGLLNNVVPGDAIRIWVPGCSTGEEVYSIAITLMELLEESAATVKIQIFGTDVSESALATARSGIYFESIANEVSEARLKRFFTKINGQYQVAKSLRNMCIFANQNVTCDPPFSQLDLISCRNVLIYFDPVLQKRVISLFHYALRSGGSLMLGPSETIGASSDIFAPTHDKKYNIFTKRPVRPRSHLEYLNTVGKSDAPDKQRLKPPMIEETEKQKREIDRITLERYAPAGVLCDDNLNVLEFRGDTAPYLVQPSGPPSINLRQLARLALFVEISNMVEQARKDHVPVHRTAQRVEMGNEICEVDLEVIPIEQKENGSVLFLVFFEKPYARESKNGAGGTGFWARLRAAFTSAPREQTVDALAVDHLQQELEATRKYIKTMADEQSDALEELKATQEELLSSNEEFQSTNEELETAKEELQSSNEELITTNDELLDRNHSLQVLNAELEKSQSYSEAIVETIREPLVVLDESLRIVTTNAAFLETFKLTTEETFGCLFYELDNKQWDIPALRQQLREILPKATNFQDFEITSDFSGIGNRTVCLNGRHLVWEDQTLILLAIEDITEHKNAQEALKAADRRKDEFLAMLAHELRNPLAPIRNALEIWRRGDAGKEAEQQAQIIMDRQLRKEARLIDDLLDIARITQGSIVLTEEAIDLRQIASQAAEGTRHQYEALNHLLEVRLPEEAVIIEGDAVRLEQIVSNLLTNAAKYTEPGGHIVLSLEVKKAQAVLRVVDNGIGIDPKMLPRIFDLFVQANASLDRSQGGLGIGLTLVRRLVTLQAGTIEARSKGLNKGSEFILRFPIVVDTPHCDESAPQEDTSDFIKRRVLIVDDHKDSANTSALLLQLKGHTAKAVYDGKTALEIAQQFKPEIVLMDIGLPGMNGYEVAKRLRAMPDQHDSLLIAISGYGHTEERAHDYGSPFDHYLMKPVDSNQLKRLFAQYDQVKETEV